MPTLPESSRVPVSMICPRCGATYGSNKVFCSNDGARLSDSLGLDASDDSPISRREHIIAGRYQVDSLIGHGSMARVYSAHDLATGVRVAVKILSQRHAASAAERRRFFDEARAAFSINHPNVVKVLDVGRRLDGRPFIVIELLEGESLGECLRRKRQLPPETALPILRDAALGLAAVHDAGIVHRDVKPDNLFLVGEYDAPTSVRLVDFGLAKLYSSAEVSETGISVGTATYMPPEQVLSEDIDARADIYALGVVIFRALTGHLPFENTKDLVTLAHQVLEKAPPLSWFLDGIDPNIENLVAKAMRKHPDNRYQTMHALAQDLQHAIDGTRSATPLDLEVDPDCYEPTTDIGKATADLFCVYLNKSVPRSESDSAPVSRRA